MHHLHHKLLLLLQIRNCVEEGLEFLGARKEFWQQQKPVYERRNEALARKRAIYHHDSPKAKGIAKAASKIMQLKAAGGLKQKLLIQKDPPQEEPASAGS